jgi:hypothetical protein
MHHDWCASVGEAAAGILSGHAFLKHGIPLRASLHWGTPKNGEVIRSPLPQVLHSLAPAVQEILQGTPLRVQLRGLEYMNDDPSQVQPSRPYANQPAQISAVRFSCLVGAGAK